MALQSLLTDPRIKASDYLFYDDNPFQAPTNQNWVGDLNTGKAFIKTYKKLITKPNQVLLPTPIYIDGAATGQFVDLPVTAVKISLGIFNRKARDKPHFWRILGYIPQVSKDKSRGKRLLIESNHCDATRAQWEAQANEGVLDGKEAQHAQDLHTMLDKILESYVKIQDSGFIWDLYYNNKLYKNVEFVPFVPFIKCNTDEGDKLCGKYGNRNHNVSQICRYCMCPTDETDDPRANYKLKTKGQIKRLVDKMDLDALRDLSQHCINNATYKLRFGLHNKCGVHSATPLEMLHAILLGIFKYMRDSFFEQTGKTSKLSVEIDALARELGTLLHRQSDRDKPKTKFSKGIRKGKLMAKEYTGILLCMLLVLRTAKGAEMLRKRRVIFSQVRLDDWVLLIETLLQWEEWMKSDTMLKKHVRAAQDKHRYIMWLIKKIANRKEGMGFKVTKFHAILHIADDILNFGVPMEVDTGSNESGHKPVKNAAKLTQKNKDTFEEQVAKRLDEVHLLDMAKEEIEGRRLWDYFEGHDDDEEMTQKPTPIPSVSGSSFRFFEDNDGEVYCHHVRKIKGKAAEIMMELPLIEFMLELKKALADHMDDVHLYTEHSRNGTMFRAHASYRNKVWRDWVWVDWGDDGGLLPNKIWGFVDLTQIPQNNGVSIGGVTDLPPGIYAVVESATMTGRCTEIVLSYETDCVKRNGKVHDLKFYLADVEAFVEPAIVVPDIGNEINRYLVVKSRQEWRESFEDWLEGPSELDEMTDIEDLDSDDEEDDLSVASNNDGVEEDESDVSDDESEGAMVTDDEAQSSDSEADDTDEDE